MSQEDNYSKILRKFAELDESLEDEANADTFANKQDLLNFF